MIARTRNGAAPRPGNPRTTAIASARISTRISATTISFRLTWKPAHTFGSATRKLNGEKNVWRTAFMLLVKDRDLREVDVEPLLLQLRDRAVRPQLLDLRVHERRELRALLEHGAVLLVRDDLRGDRAVVVRACLLLGRDDRRVEDERVAAADVHGHERGGRRLVDQRRLRRMQVLLDPEQAGRVGLRAGLQVLQVGDRMRRLRLLRQ